MKSSLEYSMNLSEKDYHAYPAWSYSLIARYAKDGFGSIATLHEPIAPTPSMEFGSLFDTIITKSRKDFEKEYFVCNTTIPDAEKKALDYIVSTSMYPHFELNDLPKEYLMSSCDKCGYQTRWGYEARLKHLMSYSDYYNAIRAGKKPVSRNDLEDALEMAKIMWTSEKTKNIFRKDSNENIEFIYQAQFCEDLDSGKEVKIKIMPDLLIVDHQFMTIQPVDLKTSSIPGWQFKDNFLKFRYDIQAELYTDIIRLIIDKDMDYRSYEIKPYIFADISRSDKLPVTYEYDPKDGLSFESNGKTYTYKRWPELLEEILNYEEQQARVPSYISLSEPNDLISILSR